MQIEPVQVHDRIYGSFLIEEQVLIDLMRSPAMQRLDGVLQHGVTGLLDITSRTTRFEHSVGVLHLVKMLGAGIEEQIASLLHDISHTAFSHVMDYVFDGYLEHSYHETHKASFLEGTEIPSILAQHGYEWRNFINDEQFSLLEQPSPALCADRLDYFFRDSLDLGLSNEKEINQVLAHLIVRDGRIVVDNLQTARWLAFTFMQTDQASWANFREVGLYKITARTIRYAVENGIITQEDFWKTDQILWEMLQNSQDVLLQKQLKQISPYTRFDRDPLQADFWVTAKLRTIDPPVLHSGTIAPLSQVDQDFARKRQYYLSTQAGQWPIRVMPNQ